jgi:hypothetical protein
VQLPVKVPRSILTMDSAARPRVSDPELDTLGNIDRHVRDPEKTRYRLHYRVVFKEYATQIYNVTALVLS